MTASLTYTAVRAIRKEIGAAAEDGPVLPSELESNAVEVDLRPFHDCGVYLLLQGKVIVYIGSSIKVGNRISSHSTGLSAKPFDRAIYIQCEEKDRLDLEGALIRHFLPKFNGHPPPWRGRDEFLLWRVGLAGQKCEYDRLMTLQGLPDSDYEEDYVTANADEDEP